MEQNKSKNIIEQTTIGVYYVITKFTGSNLSESKPIGIFVSTTFKSCEVIKTIYSNNKDEARKVHNKLIRSINRIS